MATQQQDNTMGILAHVLGLVAGFVGPLIIYLVSKDKNGNNFENAKHALNWQISLVIYVIAGFILMLVIIGIFALIALAIMNIVFSIIGAVRAGHGEVYKYPLEIRFVK